MRCRVCGHKLGIEIKSTIDSPPKDIHGNDLFLWDQVWLSDSDDFDTEAYIIEILSAKNIRVLVVPMKGGKWVEVEDLPADYVGKLQQHKKDYTTWRLK